MKQTHNLQQLKVRPARKKNVYKYNSEWEKDLWLINDAKVQFLICLYCSEAAKKSKSDNHYVTGNKIFKRDNVKNTTFHACATTFWSFLQN